MLKLMVAQILMLTYVPGDIEHFLENCVTHFDEVNYSEVLSESPNQLSTELSIFLEMDLGKQVHMACIESKQKFRFVKVSPEDAYSADDTNTIYYSPNVTSWYSAKIKEMDLPHGANLDIVTLGALIAHEIGHTPIGRLSLNLQEIEARVSSTNSNGEMITYYSRAKLKEEETRTARLFENEYRKHIGIPLRYSYYEPYDVVPKEE
jgi:hypothetical protein